MFGHDWSHSSYSRGSSLATNTPVCEWFHYSFDGRGLGLIKVAISKRSYQSITTMSPRHGMAGPAGPPQSGESLPRLLTLTLLVRFLPAPPPAQPQPNPAPEAPRHGLTVASP